MRNPIILKLTIQEAKAMGRAMGDATYRPEKMQDLFSNTKEKDACYRAASKLTSALYFQKGVRV